MSRRRAFTLVELLVVVGIIAVLIAILLPGLAQARRQARTIVCLSHLRQLAAGFHMYVAQNKGRGFETIYVNGGLGPLAIENHLFPDRRQGEQSGIMFCPEATDPMWRTSYGNSTLNQMFAGGRFRPWGYPDTSVRGEALTAPFRGSSYGMNGWLVVPPPGIGRTNANELNGLVTRKDSSRVPLLADSMFWGPTPLPTDPPPLRLSPHYSAGISYPMADSVCVARHGRAVNVAFLDGHAGTVPLAELWKLKWNNGWVDTNVTLSPN